MSAVLPHCKNIRKKRNFYYRPRSKEVMLLVASVCLSFRPSVPKSASKKSNYQSKVFVCVSVISSAGAVNQLWILHGNALQCLRPQQDLKWTCTNTGLKTISKMNRLSVYSYLTRFSYGHSRFGRLFKSLPEKIGNPLHTRHTTHPRPPGGALPLKRAYPYLSGVSAPPRAQTPGPPSQDLTSGWKQPESDNNLKQIHSSTIDSTASVD